MGESGISALEFRNETRLQNEAKSRVILRAIYGTGGYENKGIQYDELERVLAALDAAERFDLYKLREAVLGRTISFYLVEDRPPLIWDVDGLEFVGLLNISKRGRQSAPLFIELTEEGKRVAKSLTDNRRVIIRPKPSLRSSIFVVCAFGYDEIDQLYNDHFAPACGELGYTPVRVDMNEPVQTISEHIMEGITEAECVIADLTHARPSVYFEVGYAHGLGVPLLLTCRKDHYRGTNDNARVHFDLEQYKISYWSRNSKQQFTWTKGMEPAKRLTSIVSKREELE